MLKELMNFFGSKKSSEKDVVTLAKIRIKDPKTGEFVLKKAESPFFPGSWDDAKINKAIQFVATQGIQLTDGRWEGIYENVRIVGRSNKTHSILQAYPQFD